MWYDKRAKKRPFEVGDEVFASIPSHYKQDLVAFKWCTRMMLITLSRTLKGISNTDCVMSTC